MKQIDESWLSDVKVYAKGASVLISTFSKTTTLNPIVEQLI
jgi:hypothetical protein